MPSRRRISPPLPLPVRFTLLPSLLPNKSLVPLLFSEVNEIPVYLTLSPAHGPHVSFLPLLLALFPASPVHLIKLLPPDTVSLDLAGNAPFVDLWVPLQTARNVCRELGVIHLFASEGNPGSGLLCDEAGKMISWEEDQCICHNWSERSAIPSSAYSLDSVLATPFRKMTIIPEERYITTPIDRDRRACLTAAAEFDDPSRIREGDWKEAWQDCLQWTIAAWRNYCAYPSRPPIPTKLDFDSQVARTVHRLLPRLSALSRPPVIPSYPLALADIASCLEEYSPPDLATSEIFLQLLNRGLCWVGLRRGSDESRIDRLRLERRARVQLALVELVGSQLVALFSSQRGSGRPDNRPATEWMHDVDSARQREDDFDWNEDVADPADDGDAREQRTTAVLAVRQDPSLTDHTRSRHKARSCSSTRGEIAPRRVAPSTCNDTPTVPAKQPSSDPDVLALDVLHSENIEGWRMYGLVGGVILLALVLGQWPT